MLLIRHPMVFIRFARVSSHVDDFNTRNKVLTAKQFSARPFGT